MGTHIICCWPARFYVCHDKEITTTITERVHADVLKYSLWLNMGSQGLSALRWKGVGTLSASTDHALYVRVNPWPVDGKPFASLRSFYPLMTGVQGLEYATSQNFIASIPQQFWWEHNEIYIEFESRLQNCSWNGRLVRWTPGQMK